MTREEAIRLLTQDYCCNRAVCELYSQNLCQTENCEIWMAKKALEEPERKTGRWVLNEKESEKHIENIYNCSACMNFEAWGETELYKYCPNCGAKMVGVIE